MIARNATFNLIGLGAPLLVAMVCIPPLIHGLGVERFGILTLIWAVVSYFGLFDLGLGRALTQQVSVALAKNDHAILAPLIGTATALMFILGVVAGIVMAFLAPWGVGLIQDVPDRSETISATYAMAVGMPAIVLTTAFRGLMEARHAFGIINLIRVPMGAFTFLAPLLVVIWIGPRLDYIAWILVFARIVVCIIHSWYAWRLFKPDLNESFSFSSQQVRGLCVSGGWITISNVINPMMFYVDRFLISAMINPSAVAFYATPQEMVLRLSILPSALNSVLFPAFAASLASSHRKRLFLKATLWLTLIMLPFVIFTIFSAEMILSLWISEEFSSHSAVILKVLAIGMFFNCLANIPFTFLQGIGHARSAAITHVIELPLFIILLFLLIHEYGYLGAACAYLVRTLVEMKILFILSLQKLRD